MSSPLSRIDGPWLVGSGRNSNGAPIPAQVAEKLKGRTFSSFKAFREAFWKAVAATPELAAQFTVTNRSLMQRGYAPFVPADTSMGKAKKWQLHHDPQIGQHGPVYDLSTLTVVSPAQHHAIHHGNE